MIDTFEKSIVVLTSLKQQVESLLASYRSLPEIIELEYAAIRSYDIVAMQDITEKKRLVGEAIESNLELFKKSLLDLVGSYEAISGKPWSGTISLKDLNPILSAMLELIEDSGFKVKVFKFLKEEVQSLGREFFTVFNTIQPQIEANRVAVSRMLEQNHENYKFWMGVESEEAAPYDGHGVRVAKSNASTLKVRA